MSIFQNPLKRIASHWQNMENSARIFAVYCFAIFAITFALLTTADPGKIISYQNKNVTAARLLGGDVYLLATYPQHVQVRLHFDSKQGFTRTTYGPFYKFGGTMEFESPASAEEIQIYKQINYGPWSNQLCRSTSTSVAPIPQSLS